MSRTPPPLPSKNPPRKAPPPPNKIKRPPPLRPMEPVEEEPQEKNMEEKAGVEAENMEETGRQKEEESGVEEQKKIEERQRADEVKKTEEGRGVEPSSLLPQQNNEEQDGARQKQEESPMNEQDFSKAEEDPKPIPNMVRRPPALPSKAINKPVKAGSAGFKKPMPAPRPKIIPAPPLLDKQATQQQPEVQQRTEQAPTEDLQITTHEQHKQVEAQTRPKAEGLKAPPMPKISRPPPKMADGVKQEQEGNKNQQESHHQEKPHSQQPAKKWEVKDERMSRDLPAPEPQSRNEPSVRKEDVGSNAAKENKLRESGNGSGLNEKYQQLQNRLESFRQIQDSLLQSSSEEDDDRQEAPAPQVGPQSTNKVNKVIVKVQDQEQQKGGDKESGPYDHIVGQNLETDELMPLDSEEPPRVEQEQCNHGEFGDPQGEEQDNPGQSEYLQPTLISKSITMGAGHSPQQEEPIPNTTDFLQNSNEFMNNTHATEPFYSDRIEVESIGSLLLSPVISRQFSNPQALISTHSCKESVEVEMSAPCPSLHQNLETLLEQFSQKKNQYLRNSQRLEDARQRQREEEEQRVGKINELLVRLQECNSSLKSCMEGY